MKKSSFTAMIIGGSMMNKFMKTQREIEKAVVGGYKSIENGMVSGCKKIEDGVVAGYKKIEDGFVEAFLRDDSQLENEDEKRSNDNE